MKRKILCFAMIVLLLSSFILSYNSVDSSASVVVNTYSRYGEALALLNILTGSDGDLLLENKLKRIENAVILVKLSGGYKEAVNKHYIHPLKDVPSWANDYVGYLWKYEVTKGLGNKKFGSDYDISVNEFITFMLRILQYSDVKGDFSMAKSLEFARELGYLNQNDIDELTSQPFVRYHVAKYIFKLLNMPLKDQSKTLLQHLIENGSIIQSQIDDLKTVGWLINKDSNERTVLDYDGIFFEDKEFEQVIRQNINKQNGKLEKKDLESIKFLFGGFRGIRSIEGIQNLTNLKQLYLDNNQITDVSWLEQLTNLTEIHLSCNNIYDQQFLKYFIRLDNLKKLNVEQFQNFEFNYNISYLCDKKDLVLYCNRRVYLLDQSLAKEVSNIDIKEYQPEGNIDYIILLDNASLLPAIDEFYQFKSSQGFKVWVELAENISKDNKTDQADKIKNYLSVMEKKFDIKYVLLIGNPYKAETLCYQHTGGNLPMKQLYQHSAFEYYNSGGGMPYDRNDKYYHSTVNVPSDAFYIYNVDWDKNNNGYSGDQLDGLGSELVERAMYSVGRIPFNLSSNVKKILDSTIFLQQQPLKNRTLLAGALISVPYIDDSNKKIPGIDMADHMQILKNNLTTAGYPVDTMYEKEGIYTSKYSCKYSLNSDNFGKYFNTYDIIFTSGHGGRERRFWQEDKNGNSLAEGNEIRADTFFDTQILDGTISFMCMDGCSTAIVEKLENDKSSMYKETNIMSLMLEGKITAGIGTTRDSGFDPDIPGNNIICCFNVIQKNKGMGDYFVDMLNSRYLSQPYKYSSTVFMYNYFGDPSIVIY